MSKKKPKNTPTNKFEETDYYYAITKIDINEEFEFSCNKCGNCCTERDDVILSPYDIYKASKELKITPLEFVEKYCDVFISTYTAMLRVSLKPHGLHKRCPFFSNKKDCKLNKAKPAMCALFPLGRFLVSKDASNPNSKEISYVLTHTNCGTTHTYTVREWLEIAGIPANDSIFTAWCKTISELSEMLKTYEEELKQNNIWKALMQVISSIYVEYDTNKEFIPQFLVHNESLLNLTHNIKAYFLEQYR